MPDTMKHPQRREQLIVNILTLIKNEMEEEGKNLTITYTRGILEDAIKALDYKYSLLPLKLILNGR